MKGNGKKSKISWKLHRRKIFGKRIKTSMIAKQEVKKSFVERSWKVKIRKKDQSVVEMIVVECTVVGKKRAKCGMQK